MPQNLIQNHAVLLADGVRMEAYSRAIKAVVKKGDVVVDIGCGLGILSFLALQAGAEHVHAIEVEPITLSYAKMLARKSSLSKKITFHKGISSRINLPKKADVVICELFGNLGLNENILPVMIDARERLLKKGGKMIPSGVKLWFAPVEDKEWMELLAKLKDVFGFNMLCESFDLGTPDIDVKEEALLSTPELFADLDLMKATSPGVGAKCKFNIAKKGMLCGFAGWFEAILAGDIRLSTAPDLPKTHWRQGFLPIREIEPVNIGQKITFEADILPEGGMNSLMSSIGYEYSVKR